MQNMEELLSQIKSQSHLHFLSDLHRDLQNAEFFLVGGTIRDWLLGRKATHTDYDFVVRNIPLETLIEWLKKHGTVDIVGKTFGVIKFHPKGTTETVDIALPRTEQSLPDSHGGYRDVSVQSDPTLPIESDLSRRDFTVNAMALNLTTGKLVDPFGGQHDLEAHILSAVGFAPDRFKEDLTRILRGIRFATELHFEIEPETFNAMKTLVPELNQLKKQDGVSGYVVARETIGDELSKSLFADPARAIHLLQELGAFEELFPSVWRHMQVDAHYLEPITRLPPHPTPPLGQGREFANRLEFTIILLLRGLTQDEARTTLSFTGLNTIDKQSPRRLEIDRALWMIQKLGQHLTPQNISTMRASHFEKQFLGAHGSHHKTLLEHLGHSSVVDAVTKRRDEICARWKCEDHEPIPSLVSGDDVLRLGIPAGAHVREILELVRDEQLDGNILTREQALAFISKKQKDVATA